MSHMTVDGSAAVLREPSKGADTLIAKEHISSGSILFLKHRNVPNLSEKLSTFGINPDQVPTHAIDDINFSSDTYAIATLPYITQGRNQEQTGVVYKRLMTTEEDIHNGAQPIFAEVDHLISQKEVLPSTIVAHVPSEAALAHSAEYWLLADDVDHNFNERNRPRLIFYTDGFKQPLWANHDFQGVLFASTPEELQQALSLAGTLEAQKQAPESFKPDALAPKQREEYNASVENLDAWSRRTASTIDTLRLTFDRIAMRNRLLLEYERAKYSSLFGIPEKDSLTPQREIKTMLDLGTGQGRVSIPEALAGFNVLGVDISPDMLKDTRERFLEGTSGGKEVLDQLVLEDAQREVEGKPRILPLKQPLTIEEAKKHFLLAEVNAYKLKDSLNTLVTNWEAHFPDVDKHDFFNTDEYPYAFSDPDKQFNNIGFDVVKGDWNFICGVGAEANQEKMLHNVMNVLWPGGEVMLEFPKRDDPPYKEMLDGYKEAHPEPEIPYGTLQEMKDDGTPYSPRYFPSLEGMINLLKGVGFRVDPKKDIKSYVIKDPVTGIETTEYFLTARKPLAVRAA